MTDRPETPPSHARPDAPVDEYWELLRTSLRSALGRPAEPETPEPAADDERELPLPVTREPGAAGSEPEPAAERYGWAM